MTFVFSCFQWIIIGHIVLGNDCDEQWDENENFNVDAERVYYIGCVEEKWDYAPSGYNLLSGEEISPNSDASTWLWGNGEDRIGSIYVKTLYRAFTDNCFNQQIETAAEYQHLGAIGPAIRALTGETIKIFYKNMCSIPTSMHAHGLLYDKNSEGTPYNDIEGINGGDIVKSGDEWIYIWKARDNNVDTMVSSQMWLYHSHVDEVKDIHSGLIGPIIITKNGYQRNSDDLMPTDIDREYSAFFVLFDENESHLIDENVDIFLKKAAPMNDDNFIESNLMHSINGYLFGNLDDLIMSKSETVRWYTASFGNEVDGPHSPHWHGNIAIDTVGANKDTLVLIPGTTSTVTMKIDSPGVWLFHCHVFDHIVAGMITTYTANP